MRVRSALLTLLFIAACGDGTGPEVAPAIAVMAPVPDSAIAGAPLGSVAVVVTRNGTDAVRGAWVKFAIVQGVGQLSSDSVQTNDAGVAEVLWTLGAQPGIQAVRATITGGEVTFTTRGAPVRAQVSTGLRHTCALNARGTAHCWGSDEYGQLGNDGELAGRQVPTRVGGEAPAFWSISAGSAHTCGVAVDHRVFCWGNGYDGQLGNGVQLSPTPKPVGGSTRFAKVAAGALHTCALTASGEAWCWGHNTYGQIGGVGGSGVPRQVQGPAPFSQLAGGGMHTCGRTMSGMVYCWGYNGLGQLGDGTQADRGFPVSVTGPAMSTISAGSAVSCATATGGVSYCWGEDNFEQLGNGSGENPCMIKEFRHRCSTTPVAVQPAIGFGVLAPGFIHVCALTPAGAAWCWGDNTMGQLGTGGASSATARAVAHPQPFQDIDTGQFHTCAITSTYAVQCWGENSSGQLGDGTASRRPTPASIAGGTLPQH